jgi:hypothetical protein
MTHEWITDRLPTKADTDKGFIVKVPHMPGEVPPTGCYQRYSLTVPGQPSTGCYQHYSLIVPGQPWWSYVAAQQVRVERAPAPFLKSLTDDQLSAHHVAVQTETLHRAVPALHDAMALLGRPHPMNCQDVISELILNAARAAVPAHAEQLMLLPDCGPRNKPLMPLLIGLVEALKVTAQAVADNALDERYPIDGRLVVELSLSIDLARQALQYATAPKKPA